MNFTPDSFNKMFNHYDEVRALLAERTHTRLGSDLSPLSPESPEFTRIRDSLLSRNSNGTRLNKT